MDTEMLNKMAVAFFKTGDVQGFNRLRDINPNWKPCFMGYPDLHGVDFSKANLVGACFSALNLKGANFAWSYLHGVTFCGANLEGVIFSNSVLIGANFFRAILHGADFDNAQVMSTDFYCADFKGVKNLDKIPTLGYCIIVGAKNVPQEVFEAYIAQLKKSFGK